MSSSHPGGFEVYESALSWGQFVTSITMTIFYLLYYYYYKRISGSNSKGKDILVYVLAIARIVLTLLPQNEWGKMPGNLTFGIIRNIDTVELIKRFKTPILYWVGGLYFTIVTMAVRGISQIVGDGYLPFPDAALAGIAGLGHVALGVGIVWTILVLINREKRNVGLAK